MSTPDFYNRATHFFLLAEQASRWEWSCDPFRTVSASFAPDPAAHLPGLEVAVSKEMESLTLEALACHPLPVRLSPESVPWYDALVAAWEIHRASCDLERRRTAQLALVRLDGCSPPDGTRRPSRLAEWLEEARRMVGAGYEPARTGSARTIEGLKTLAALATWRPAPDVVTSLETLCEWVGFWRHIRQSRSPFLKGIAAKALLNLPEADLRAASIRPVPPEKLLRELTAAIPVAAERTSQGWYRDYLFLLDWQPGENNPLPAAGVAEVARAWLDITRHGQWHCRQRAWEQLTRWDRAGSLAIHGVELLPFLVEAAQTEKNEFVLWEMARWRPAAEFFTGTEKPDGLDLLRQLETAWQRHRQSGNWVVRASTWLAGTHLRQAGLATESPERFQEAYLSAVAQEPDVSVMSVLAQWAPGPDALPDVHRKWQRSWQRRLEDESHCVRQVAGVALLRQAVEGGTGQVLRHAALEVWRTGTNEATETYHQLGDLVSRFHEVRAHLVAGTGVDFRYKLPALAEKQCPRLTLPPGSITDRQWKIENGGLKMES